MKVFGSKSVVREEQVPVRIGRYLTVLDQKATANYVPAAAVIRSGKRCPELLGVKGSQAVP